MKTDPLFYELFQVRPQIYFELLQIPQPCPYRFESITVKAGEKRIDGVLEPTEPGQPIHFVEVQALLTKKSIGALRAKWPLILNNGLSYEAVNGKPW